METYITMENHFQSLHVVTVTFFLTKLFSVVKMPVLNPEHCFSCEGNSMKARARVHTADGRTDGGPEQEPDKRRQELAEQIDAKVALFNPTTKINSLISECSYLPAHELYICMNPP